MCLEDGQHIVNVGHQLPFIRFFLDFFLKEITIKESSGEYLILLLYVMNREYQKVKSHTTDYWQLKV